jgi:hypothetical protein
VPLKPGAGTKLAQPEKGRFNQARLTSNVVRGFCLRSFYEDFPIGLRSSSEIHEIFPRNLRSSYDGNPVKPPGKKSRDGSNADGGNGARLLIFLAVKRAGKVALRSGRAGRNGGRYDARCLPVRLAPARLGVRLANPSRTQEMLSAKPPPVPVSARRSLRRTSLRRLIVESFDGPVHRR